VVEALLGGPQRFNDLPGQNPGIAANILSERLKRLELEAGCYALPGGTSASSAAVRSARCGVSGGERWRSRLRA
jgi:HxlR-like helix-turn-helix protein